MGTNNIPMNVLSDQISDAIAGRRVRTGLFTTFTFDPGFFELQILPLLFDQTFSQAGKLRLIQLEDALRDMKHMAVYYDRSALAQDAEPASLDYRRIDVRRRTGCFHPKVIFLLVDEPREDYDIEEDADNAFFIPQSLIVAVMSANLTRGGWWENVECAHIEEINDKSVNQSRFAYRRDLLDLLTRIKSNAGEGDTHYALEDIREYLRKRTVSDTFKTASINGYYHTRLFCGQQNQSFSEWLSTFRLKPNEWNLEVISPYFNKNELWPLWEMVDAVSPKEVRVYLPLDLDGKALVSESVYQSGRDERYVFWSNLPGSVVNRGKDEISEVLPPRRVHAKVYRLWNRQGGDIIIVGSVNLTLSAHSHSSAGNLEAAFLVNITNQRFPRRWWLERMDEIVEEFVETEPAEEDGLENVFLDISLRFDWATHQLEYRLDMKKTGDFSILDLSGRILFSIEKPVNNEWCSCSIEASQALKEYLSSSSFVLVQHQSGNWRVLIREENLAYRPSLFNQLSPEEIMEYWSLLTADQRASFIEGVFNLGVELEGLQIRSNDRLISRNTIFDRFAGIYHAFGCSKKYIVSALDEGRDNDAIVRLLGAKYDSVPSLLHKIRTTLDYDPILQYVTFLNAQQLRNEIFHEYPEFFLVVKENTSPLNAELERLPELRKKLPLDQIDRSDDFLEWFEDAFLTVPGTEELS